MNTKQTNLWRFSQLLKVIFAFIFAFIFANPALAAPKDDVRMQISPVRQKLSLKPGQRYVGTFELRNVGKKEFTYKLSASPYQVVGDKYENNYNTRNKYTQIVDWVSFNKTGDKLAPEKAHTIEYTINVPMDVPAGGQYLALMAETEDGSPKGSTVKTINRLGLILSASIEGDTRIEGRLLSQNLDTFFFNSPIFATSLVENTGNVGLDAKYTLTVRSFFTNEEVYSNSLNPVIKEILPETRRFNTNPWNNSPQLGIFKVKQTVEILGKVSEIEKVVFVCPIWLIIIFIIVFFIIVYQFLIRRKKS